MPELPEVETIRRTLLRHLIGRQVGRVVVHRHDIVAGVTCEEDLLGGCRIVELRRHGKQLAIIGRPVRVEQGGRRPSPADDPGANARAVIIRLGMTGQVIFLPGHVKINDRRHVHLLWTILNDGREGPTRASEATHEIEGRLIFRDARRFGRVAAVASLQALCAEWSRLGPDALGVRGAAPRAMVRLWRARSSIKSALLNQSLLAGIGNIYADEALFRAGIHPARRCYSLSSGERQALMRAIDAVLHASIRAGGSSVRDYLDGTGRRGTFTLRHRVYGRAGCACFHCGGELQAQRISHRTTVWCPRCQPMRLAAGEEDGP